MTKTKATNQTNEIVAIPPVKKGEPVPPVASAKPIDVDVWLDESEDEMDWRETELARQAATQKARQVERDRLSEALLQFLAPRK